MSPDIETMLTAHDAALVIGDPALQIDRSRYFTLDLAEEWIRYTGKPFVFAFWAVRQQALRETASSQDLAAVFQQSRDHGLEPASLDQITREWGRDSASRKPTCVPTSPKVFITTWMQRALKACNSSIAMRLKSEPCHRSQNYFSRRKSLYSVSRA